MILLPSLTKSQRKKITKCDLMLLIFVVCIRRWEYVNEKEITSFCMLKSWMFGKFSWLVCCLSFCFSLIGWLTVRTNLCVWLNHWANQSCEFINFFPSRENQHKWIHIVHKSILFFGIRLNEQSKKCERFEHMFCASWDVVQRNVLWTFLLHLIATTILAINIFLFPTTKKPLIFLRFNTMRWKQRFQSIFNFVLRFLYQNTCWCILLSRLLCILYINSSK